MVTELVIYVFRVFISIIGGTPDKRISEGFFRKRFRNEFALIPPPHRLNVLLTRIGLSSTPASFSLFVIIIKLFLCFVLFFPDKRVHESFLWRISLNFCFPNILVSFIIFSSIRSSVRTYFDVIQHCSVLIFTRKNSVRLICYRRFWIQMSRGGGRW